MNPEQSATQADDRFSAFLLSDTSQVEIDLPNGEPMLFEGNRVVVHLYGPSSERYIEARDVLDREATKRTMQAVNEVLTKRKTKETEDRDSDAKFLTAVTDRIDNFPYPGGPAAVYRTPQLRYIAAQVRAHLNDLANFFKGNETS